MTTYRKRFIWFEMEPTEEPAEYPPAPAGYENDPEPDPEPFRAKILVNPTVNEVRHEREVLNAYMAGNLSEPEYLAEISGRVIDWNLEVVATNAETGHEETIKVAAPGAHPENPDSVNAWYELTADQLGWLLRLVRIGHLPKSTTPTLAPVGITDSTTETPQPTNTQSQSHQA